MKRNDPTFKEMVARILSGELTRKQAADAYGIKENTLTHWLLRGKIATPKQPKVLAGAALEWTKPDPVRRAALDEAVSRVLSGELTGDQAFALYADQGVARATLFYEVRKILAKQGVVRPRGRPPVNPPVILPPPEPYRPPELTPDPMPALSALDELKARHKAAKITPAT